MRNTYEIWVGNVKGKDQLGDYVKREDNIKMNLKGVWCEDETEIM